MRWCGSISKPTLLAAWRPRAKMPSKPRAVRPCTLFDYFDLWNWDGTLDRVDDALYVKCREAMEREPSPAACIINSQSVKGAEKMGACIDPHGYDAGKKIKGK